VKEDKEHAFSIHHSRGDPVYTIIS